MVNTGNEKTQQDEEPIDLTLKQALAMLPDGEQIHTFRSNSIALIGADWSRQALLNAMSVSQRLEIGGAQCRSVNHGLVVWTDEQPLFVECCEGVDYEQAGVRAETKNAK